MIGSRIPVAIVGGGPAGLALAARLRAHRIECRVFERGRLAESWWHFPPTMRLLSPWWTNVLDRADAFSRSPVAVVEASVYRDYLLGFAARHRLSVQCRAEVVALEPENSGWRLELGDGERLRAAAVVLATGYFAAPRGAEPPFESDGSLPVLHAAAVEDYDGFAATYRGRTVVLVGKRVSAGQLMVELARRGLRVVLSARSPLVFRRADRIGRVRDQVYFLWEWLRIRFQPRLRANSFPPMDGGETERLLASGAVRLVGPIRRVAQGLVEPAAGEPVHADLIVLATGYRPALSLIQDRVTLDPSSGLPPLEAFAVRGQSRLFLLGFDNLYNFRSRYLRGIREDARRLARLLARELG